MFTEDWTPTRACCHANVDFRVKRNPHLRPVRGWMTVSQDESGRGIFAAHSVIDDGGELYDITLSDQAECDLYRFLEHLGTGEEFWAVEGIRRVTEYPFFESEDVDSRGAEDDIEDGDPDDVGSAEESDF